MIEILKIGNCSHNKAILGKQMENNISVLMMVDCLLFLAYGKPS